MFTNYITAKAEDRSKRKNEFLLLPGTKFRPSSVFSINHTSFRPHQRNMYVGDN